MSWARLDDGFDEHEKLLAVGPLGLALWVAGLGYCSRNLTDGFIPTGKVYGLVSWRTDFCGASWVLTLDSGAEARPVDTELVVDLLVHNRLWKPVEGGFEVHDYLVYNPSRAEVLAKRDADRARQRRSRSGKARGEAVSPAVENVSRRDSRRNPERPVPVPVTTTNRSAVRPTLVSVPGRTERAGSTLDEDLRVADLVAELVSRLEDPGSRRYFEQVVRRHPEELIRSVLSEVTDRSADRRVRSKGALFTTLMRKAVNS